MFFFIIHFVALHSKGNGGSLCMVKWLGHKTASTTSYVLKVQCLIKQRNNFTFTTYLAIATKVCDALATLI